MEHHALEATGGQHYAEMGRFLTPAGKPTRTTRRPQPRTPRRDSRRERSTEPLGDRDRTDDRSQHDATWPSSSRSSGWSSDSRSCSTGIGFSWCSLPSAARCSGTVSQAKASLGLRRSEKAVASAEWRLHSRPKAGPLGRPFVVLRRSTVRPWSPDRFKHSSKPASLCAPSSRSTRCCSGSSRLQPSSPTRRYAALGVIDPSGTGARAFPRHGDRRGDASR